MCFLANTSIMSIGGKYLYQLFIIIDDNYGDNTIIVN